MNVLDIVLLVLLLFGLIRGLYKGFFVEVASLVALVAGIYGAIHFSNFAADFLQSKVTWGEPTINIIAFAITFAIIVVAIALAGKALTKLANFAALGLINKLLGGIFGVLKVALILSVVLLIYSRFSNTFLGLETVDTESSVLYKPVAGLAPKLFPNIINNYLPTTPEENTAE